MLKINGSAVDNHRHPPLFCTAVADRLIQLLTPVFTRRMAHAVSHTQINAYSTSQLTTWNSHPHLNKYHVNEAQQTVLSGNQCQVFTTKEANTLWKQPSLKCVSSCCSPRHLHYPPLCCRSLALLSAYPHFVTIIHSGLAFWHACKLANYRMASCH